MENKLRDTCIRHLSRSDAFDAYPYISWCLTVTLSPLCYIYLILSLESNLDFFNETKYGSQLTICVLSCGAWPSHKAKGFWHFLWCWFNAGPWHLQMLLSIQISKSRKRPSYISCLVCAAANTIEELEIEDIAEEEQRLYKNLILNWEEWIKVGFIIRWVKY